MIRASKLKNFSLFFSLKYVTRITEFEPKIFFLDFLIQVSFTAFFTHFEEFFLFWGIFRKN